MAQKIAKTEAPPKPQNLSPSVRPEAAPTEQRRRPSKDDQRKAAAERARRARDKRKQREDPEAAAREAADKAADAAKAAQDAEEARRTEAERIAKLETRLIDAIAGTVEALAEGAQAFLLDEQGPHLGNARSRAIAESWAPILAPYIDASGAKHLPLILASTGTAGAVMQWAGEYREYRGQRDGKPARRPMAVPQAVVA